MSNSGGVLKGKNLSGEEKWRHFQVKMCYSCFEGINPRNMIYFSLQIHPPQVCKQFTSFVYGNRKTELKNCFQVFMHCQVSTYSGHRLHERPLAFTWKGQRLAVREVLEQGYGPDSLFFKVAAADGGVYLLVYQRGADSWEVGVCASRKQDTA
jgi:hypothetical protein